MILGKEIDPNSKVIISKAKPRWRWIGLLIIISIVLGFSTVFYQAEYLRDKGSLERQKMLHFKFMTVRLGNPWQYRVLSEYVLELMFRLKAPESDIVDNSTKEVIGRWNTDIVLLLRMIQNILIFLLFAWYLQILNLSRRRILLGISLLGTILAITAYKSDFCLNSYFDVLFFIIIGVLILKSRYIWIIPIIILAALNRETSGFIPIMLIALSIIRFPNLKIANRIEMLLTGIITMVIYIFIFFLLRASFPPQVSNTLYWPMLRPGWVILFNLTYVPAWSLLFSVFGLLPFLSIKTIKIWPPILKAFFWILVPAWVFCIYFLGDVQETRLLLVPIILVILPGLLFGLDYFIAEQKDISQLIQSQTPLTA